MIKQFHHPDQLFRAAYQTHEEPPSASVWDKINSDLDKVEAERYKRKFKQWKKLSLFLILFLCIYILFESLLNKEAKSMITISNFEQKKGHSELNAMIKPVSGLLSVKNKPLRVTNTGMHLKKSPVFITENMPKENKARPFLSGFPEEDIRPVFSGPGLAMVSKKNADSLKMSNPSTYEIQKQKAFKKNWSLSGLVSLDMAEYRIDNDLTHHDAKTLIEGRESHNASFSLAILANYQFSKKWAVRSGIRYSNILIGINPHEIYAVQQASGNASYKYVTSSGYALIIPDFQTSGDSLQTASARHHLVFVSLPVMLQYRIAGKKWALTPSLGMQVNCLAKAAVKTEIHEGLRTELVSINQLQGKKTFYMSFLAEAGLAYRMNSRWDVNAIPSFQYGVSSITRNNAVNTYPYSVGLSLGITRHF